MSRQLKTTVAYRSNIQPIKKRYIMEDREFLSAIRNPFALSAVYKKAVKTKRYDFSPIQDEEYRKASEHCIYADTDEYPFGTIIDSNGRERVVCKCINVNCERFKLCRPDFRKEELNVLKDNDIFEARIDAFFNKKTAIETQPVSDDAILPMTPNPPPNKPSNSNSIISVLSAKPTEIIDEQKGQPMQTPVAHPATAQVLKFPELVEATQDNIIKSPILERIVVNAGPGTGKTWTLIEKIVYMLGEENVDPQDILVFCFSRAAVSVIEARLLQAYNDGRISSNWRNIEVRTFDSFSTYMIAFVQQDEQLKSLLPKGYALSNKSYDERILTAKDLLFKKKDMLGSYKHVFIDEVQDLVGPRAEMVLVLLENLLPTCGFTVLGDACQALFDYQVEQNPQLMTSQKFYEQLFKQFPNIIYYSLSENHRQNDILNPLVRPYRKAILSGDISQCISAAKTISNQIETLPVPFNKLDFQDDIFQHEGSLGILTRNNGEALELSYHLNNHDIEHSILLPGKDSMLDDWIANVFMTYGNQTINEKLFCETFVNLYPGTEAVAVDYWRALISLQTRACGNNYEVSDLLHGLFNNVKNELFFTPVLGKGTNRIIVANVHQAKGREFDRVMATENLMYSGKSDNIGEHKVCYVAMTRPKELLVKVPFSCNNCHSVEGENGAKRYFTTKYKSKTDLNYFEMGMKGDFNEKSFAASKNQQDIIRRYLVPGVELLLKKNINEKRIYDIVLEDLGQLVGKTSDKLSTQMIKLEGNWHIAFPEKFGRIYVDKLITCIAPIGSDLPGAVRYGDLAIWTGLSVSCFAKADYC